MTRKDFQKRVASQHEKLYRVALALTHDEDEACDVVQDTMLNLWNKRELLSAVDDIGAYCVGALRNCFFDSRRRSHVTTSLSEVELEESDSDVTVRNVEADSSLSLVSRIISTLPENQQLVVRLSAVAGCSNEEIVEITGLSAVNVRTLLSRGRRRIKELYSINS